MLLTTMNPSVHCIAPADTFKTDKQGDAGFIPTVSLCELTSSALFNRFRRLKSSPYKDPERFLHDLETSSAPVPDEIRFSIRQLRVSPDVPGYLLINNLPIDADLPRTPLHGGRASEKLTCVSEASLLLIGQLVGEPYAYFGEKEEQIVHNICPDPRKAESVSSSGFRAAFHHHTEVAFAEFRPDFLQLLCVRGDPTGKAATFLAEAREVVKRLSQETLAILRQPWFQARVPQSFDDIAESQRWAVPHPIISGPSVYPEIRMNPGTRVIPGIEDRAQEALDEFRRVIHGPDVTHQLVLTPGQLLIVCNRRCAHGRNSFQPIWNGQERWLQRCYLRRDLWPGRSSAQASLRVF